MDLWGLSSSQGFGFWVCVVFWGWSLVLVFGCLLLSGVIFCGGAYHLCGVYIVLVFIIFVFLN